MDAFIQANGTGGYAVGTCTEMNIASILTFTSVRRLVGGVSSYSVRPVPEYPACEEDGAGR